MRDKIPATDATDNYFERLTAAEFDEHEKIELELNDSVRDGFSERCALAFVKTAFAIRKMEPSATIDGIFDTALVIGLAELLIRLSAEIKPARRSAPKRGKRSGVDWRPNAAP